MRTISLLICCLPVFRAGAQVSFRAGADLDRVAAAGFYSLIIRPALSAQAQTDLSDVRLLDERGAQVPYLLPAPDDSLLPNPAPVVNQTDSSDGFSYLLLAQPEPYVVSMLQLTVEKPRFFQRSLNIRVEADPFGTAHETSLRSGMQPLQIALPRLLKADKIRLIIRNGDNPPLHISGVQTLQPQQRIVAWLEAGKRYRLVAGNGRLAAPQYDLVYFRDSVPEHPPLVGYGPVVTGGSNKSSGKAAPLPAKNPAARKTGAGWIWPLIAASVLVLGTLAWRLLAEMRRRNL